MLPLNALRWVVGTGLIYAEWQVYTTPLLRRSTPLAVVWYLFCAALSSPFLLLWAPLEAATVGYLHWAGIFGPVQQVPNGIPRNGAMPTGALRSSSGRSPSPARARRHSPTTGQLRVVSYNIQSGVGSDMRCDLPRVARSLRRMGPLDLVALQEIDITEGEDQVAEIARLAGFAHHAFVGTRPSELGKGEYGDAILSKLPIEETHVHWFRQWWLRAQRACLFVRVQPPGSGSVWFGSGHLQHDITSYENSEQFVELRDAIAALPGAAAATTAVGLDANMLGIRMANAAHSAGLVEHCGAAHPSTFPAIRPLYRLDGLLSSACDGVELEVSSADMRLSAEGSADPETGEQVSDHMPVLGTLLLH